MAYNKICVHGRNRRWCCECRYGKMREIENQHIYDYVDELRAGVGYKLIKGHFGDIPYEMQEV